MKNQNIEFKKPKDLKTFKFQLSGRKVVTIHYEGEMEVEKITVEYDRSNFSDSNKTFHIRVKPQEEFTMPVPREEPAQ